MTKPAASTSFLGLLLLFPSLSGCGGTEDAPRGSGPVTGSLIGEDSGGRPAVCSDEDAYEFLRVEDFEHGAATGWYTNTDVCKPCNDLDGDLNALNRPLGCLLGNGVLELIASEDPTLHAELEPQTREIRRISEGCSAREVVEWYFPEDLSNAEVLEHAVELLAALLEWRTALAEQFQDCGIEACRASQTPFIFDKPLPAEPIINGPRCESSTAMHIVAPKLRGFGGTFGRSFSPAEPWDLREWDGIAFWARVGPGSRTLVKVSIPERQTDEKVWVDGKPVCYFDTTEDDTSQGCDKHGSWVSLTEDWKLYTLPFSEMRQAGWGKIAALFDTEAVTGVSFEYQAGSWDLWFDDIRFYRRK